MEALQKELFDAARKVIEAAQEYLDNNEDDPLAAIKLANYLGVSSSPIRVTSICQKEVEVSKHYPDGYTPQTYGERKLADGMSTEAIQKAIDAKAKMKIENPSRYRREFCGTSGKDTP